MNKNRRGLALPLMLAFVICLVTLTIALVFSRKESKQQNLSNVHFLQANFLAQSAIQMMMLKLSVYHQDLSDAGTFSLGYCPFRGIIAGDSELQIYSSGADAAKLAEPLADFCSDCNTGSFPWKSSMSINGDDWKFRVKSLKVINAYTDLQKKELVFSVQITAEGESVMARGGMNTRKEEMTKIVQLTRKISN